MQNSRLAHHRNTIVRATSPSARKFAGYMNQATGILWVGRRLEQCRRTRDRMASKTHGAAPRAGPHTQQRRLLRMCKSPQHNGGEQGRRLARRNMSMRRPTMTDTRQCGMCLRWRCARGRPHGHRMPTAAVRLDAKRIAQPLAKGHGKRMPQRQSCPTTPCGARRGHATVGPTTQRQIGNMTPNSKHSQATEGIGGAG